MSVPRGPKCKECGYRSFRRRSTTLWVWSCDTPGCESRGGHIAIAPRPVLDEATATAGASDQAERPRRKVTRIVPGDGI